MTKEYKVNGKTFTVKNGKLYQRVLKVNDNGLYVGYNKACMSNGCTLIELAKAYNNLIKQQSV